MIRYTERRELLLRYHIPNAGQMYSSMITLGDNILELLLVSWEGLWIVDWVEREVGECNPDEDDYYSTILFCCYL